MFTKLVRQLAPQTGRPADRRRLGAVSGVLGLTLNLLLFGGKYLVGRLTGSVSIVADALNNLSDAGSSAVTFIGFRMAGQKPDDSHPFGHGRMEYVSGLLIALSILVMGVELLKTSVEKILTPVLPEFRWVSVAVLGASVCVKLWMYGFHRALGRAAASAALSAVAKDSFSDAAATGAVLAGTLLEHFTGLYLDGYLGILIALFILYSGATAARDTISPLLGQPPDPELVRQMVQTVRQQPEICGVHDLVVHDYGPGRTMVSLHAEVADTGDIVAIHEAIDRAERALKTAFHCDAVIHVDPIVTGDPKTQELQNTVSALVRLIDPAASVHDFRMSRTADCTRLIFEVAVPSGLTQTDAQITASIQAAVRTLDASYEAVVTIDRIPAPPRSLPDT